jgi:tetratricopeptide (TPR) repeat protein
LSLASCLLHLERPREAIDILEGLDGEEEDQALLAELQMGRAYEVLGSEDRALEIFDSVAGGKGADSLKARAKIEKAATLNGLGRPEEAIRQLEIADSLVAKTAPETRAEIAYRIGRIYEASLGDFDKASEAYDRAATMSAGFSRLAAQRSSALKRIRRHETTLTDSIPDSPEDRARARFLMAESYLMDLGMTARALDEYRVVIDSFPASEFAARAMLTAADLRRSENDIAADSLYRAVMERFPETVYDNVARDRLDLPIIDLPDEQPVPGVPDSLLFAEEGEIDGPPASAPDPSEARDRSVAPLPGEPSARPGPRSPRARADTTPPPDGLPPDSMGTVSVEDSSGAAESPDPDTTGGASPGDTTSAGPPGPPADTLGTSSPRDTSRAAASPDTTGERREEE